MSDKERDCHICGTHCTTWCPKCVADFENRQAAEEMTPEERVSEFEMWEGPLEIPIRMLHKRLEELVGRPIWTHELGTEGCEPLKAEILDSHPATMSDVLNKIPKDKDVILVGDSDAKSLA